MNAQQAPFDDWYFYQRYDKTWSWRFMEGASSIECAGTFPTFIEAMADAIGNGFNLGASRIAAIQELT